LNKNPLEIFGDFEEKKAIELFDKYEYGAAYNLFEKLKDKVMDPREFEVKSLLALGYMYWDAFDYTRALKVIEKARAKIDQYKITSIDLNKLDVNLHGLRLLESYQIHEGNAHNILKDEHASIHLLGDILRNAHRRAEQI